MKLKCTPLTRFIALSIGRKKKRKTGTGQSYFEERRKLIEKKTINKAVVTFGSGPFITLQLHALAGCSA